MSNLQAIRDLLTPPTAWTQGEYADNPAKPTCWCLIGAVRQVRGAPVNFETLNADADVKLLASLITPNGCPSRNFDVVTAWNDHSNRTHADVLALLDKAISQRPPDPLEHRYSNKQHKWIYKNG